MRSALVLLSVPVAVALRLAPSRRAVLGGAAAGLVGLPAFAADEAPFTTFTDPLFEVAYPKDFFAIRRTIDGDISRRGGVIFTAGQLKTAEIVTVELYPVKDLLKQAEALPYFPEGAIKRWNDLGSDDALGNFICERRDNEANSAAKGQQVKARASEVVPGTLSVAGNVLQADVLSTLAPTDMRVGEAGTLQKTPGIRRLARARLTLLPGGREVMGVWASCLDDYWADGERDVLARVVASFRPTKAGSAPILEGAASS